MSQIGTRSFKWWITDLAAKSAVSIPDIKFHDGKVIL